MGKRISNYEELPTPNKKVYDLVQHYTDGNVAMFADYIGVTQQILDRIFKKDSRNGKYPKVSDKIKNALKEKYNLKDVWFYDENDEQSSEEPKMSYTNGVPYYNVDFIGGFDLILNDQTTIPEYKIDFKKYNSADCWCNVTGHSMEPEISPGDIIALKELHDWRIYIPSGEIYGIVTTEHRTIKKVTPSNKEGFIKLIPSNQSPEFVPQDIPISIIRKVYKVLGCMKRL